MLPWIDPAGSLPAIPDFHAWAENYAAERDAKEKQFLSAEGHRLAKAAWQAILEMESDEITLGADASYLRAHVADSASAWIVDDDVPPLTMAATDDTASEAGQGPTIFIVSRSGDTCLARTAAAAWYWASLRGIKVLACFVVCVPRVRPATHLSVPGLQSTDR